MARSVVREIRKYRYLFVNSDLRHRVCKVAETERKGWWERKIKPVY